MSKMRAWLLVASFATTSGICRAQTVIPNSLPELNYPPIARAAHVQGDVVVSFRQTPEGRALDVTPVSGPLMLQRAAVENVKAWHLEPKLKPATHVSTVTFHFQLDPPDDGYNAQHMTKIVLDGAGRVNVISIPTTGLTRSECPRATDRVPPKKVTAGDYVELQRWNEEVRVDTSGLIVWKQGENSQRGQITSAQAKSLLEHFRTPAIWSLCGRYDQSSLMDGGASSFKIRINGREKGVGEYGDAAPPIFRQVELVVDVSLNTHQWRHGDPKTESIVEITFESLPKPGKTVLMDAARSGDKTAYQAALAAGDKLTDADASGWTPLMYAASSYGYSAVSEMLKAGANVNARSMRGETALMASAAKGMAGEALLNAGAEVDAVNDAGMTALMLLAQHADPDETQKLLKAGADARKTDLQGRTALDYLNAANCGSPIIQEKDPRWMTVGYSTCNARDTDDYQKSKRLLLNAGAKETITAMPAGLSQTEQP